MKKACIMILLLCLLLGNHAGAEEESMGILYRVSGGRNELYLLGSIHIGLAEMQPYGTSITEAMDACDVFGFECDSENLLSSIIMQTQARYSAGDSLRCHVSEETLSLLERVAKAEGLSLNRMLTYKPWAILNALLPQTVQLLLGGEEDGLEAISQGVDSTVRSMAEGKKFVYLETVQEQTDALNALSDSLQEEMLAETLRLLLGEAQAEGMDQDMKYWAAWWKNGDADAFAESYRKTSGAEADEEYLRIMLTQRNDRMSERLIQLLENEEEHSYFVTLGLMHLVLREDSVLTRLEQAGYSVSLVRDEP